MKAEQQRQEAKHKKQWEELTFKNETALRELEQLQVRSCGIAVPLSSSWQAVVWT